MATARINDQRSITPNFKQQLRKAEHAAARTDLIGSRHARNKAATRTAVRGMLFEPMMMFLLMRINILFLPPTAL